MNSLMRTGKSCLSCGTSFLVPVSNKLSKYEEKQIVTFACEKCKCAIMLVYELKDKRIIEKDKYLFDKEGNFCLLDEDEIEFRKGLNELSFL